MEADSWVEEQLAAGRSPEDIREDLEEAGWSETQIDRIMDRVSTPPPDQETAPPTQRSPETGGRKKRLLLYAGLLLLAAAIGFGAVWAVMQVL